MKSIITTIFPLMLALIICSSWYSGTTGSSDKYLEKVMTYYKEHYDKEQLYLKFSVQTVENGEIGDKLVAEMWKSGNKFRYSNPFLTVYQDDNTQVMISDDKKVIFLRNEKGKSAGAGQDMSAFSVQQQLDTLKKRASSIRHADLPGGLIQLTIDLPEKVNGKPNTLRSVILEHTKSGEIKKGEYVYRSGTAVKKEIYEYLGYSDKFDSSILQGSALGRVMNGNKLKKEFAGYALQDLRNLKK